MGTIFSATKLLLTRYCFVELARVMMRLSRRQEKKSMAKRTFMDDRVLLDLLRDRLVPLEPVKMHFVVFGEFFNDERHGVEKLRLLGRAEPMPPSDSRLCLLGNHVQSTSSCDGCPGEKSS